MTIRPLAGTRRRGGDEAEDGALARELLADPKERAEHIMLVDLGRNDVGRVADVDAVDEDHPGLLGLAEARAAVVDLEWEPVLAGEHALRVDPDRGREFNVTVGGSVKTTKVLVGLLPASTPLAGLTWVATAVYVVSPFSSSGLAFPVVHEPAEGMAVALETSLPSAFVPL